MHYGWSIDEIAALFLAVAVVVGLVGRLGAGAGTHFLADLGQWMIPLQLIYLVLGLVLLVPPCLMGWS